MVPEGSLLHSQWSAVCICSESDRYSLRPVAFFFPLCFPPGYRWTFKQRSFVPDVCEHRTYYCDVDCPLCERCAKQVEEVSNGVFGVVLDVSDHHQHGEEEAGNLPHRQVQECVVSRGLQVSEELGHGCGQERTTLLFWFCCE